jgi:hypothetical protein
MRMTGMQAGGPRQAPLQRTVRPLILALLLCLPLSVQAVTLSAALDKSTVAVGEDVTLTVTLVDGDERLRAEGINPNVDLTPLHKRFDFGPPQAEHRFRIERGRGRPVSTLTVTLFPRHPGDIQIPAFHIGGQSTQPMVLRVRRAKPGSAPPVFLRSGIDKPRVWVNEQVVAYLDLYYRTKLSSAKIGAQLASKPAAGEIHELAKSERRERADGFDYNVLRTAWALFPTQSGRLTVQFPDLWIVTEAGKRVHLPAEDRIVAVRLLPKNVPPRILVGKPALVREAVTGQAHVDALSTWRVTIKAPASMASLPDQLPLPDAKDRFRIFADHPKRRAEATSSNYLAIAEYTVSILPLTSGELVLPALRLPYFDPHSAAVKTVSARAQTINVAGKVPTVTRDVAVPASGVSGSNHSASSLPWMVAALAFAALWLATLAGVWLQSRHRRKQGNPANPSPGSKTLANASSSQRPWLEKLRISLGHTSLEIGLRNREALYGTDDELRTTIADVQSLCYSSGSVLTEQEVAGRVNAVVDRLQQNVKAPTAAQVDRWSPKAFTLKLKN